MNCNPVGAEEKGLIIFFYFIFITTLSNFKKLWPDQKIIRQVIDTDGK